MEFNSELIEPIEENLKTDTSVIDLYSKFKKTGFYAFSSFADNFKSDEIDFITKILLNDFKMEKKKLNIIKSDTESFEHICETHGWTGGYDRINFIQYFRDIIEEKKHIDVSDCSDLGLSLNKKLIKIDLNILKDFIKNQSEINELYDYNFTFQLRDFLIISDTEIDNDILHLITQIIKIDWSLTRPDCEKILVLLIISFDKFEDRDRFTQSLETIFHDRDREDDSDVLLNSGITYFFADQRGKNIENMLYDHPFRLQCPKLEKKLIFDHKPSYDDFQRLKYLDLFQLKNDNGLLSSSRATSSITYLKNINLIQAGKYNSLDVEIEITNKLYYHCTFILKYKTIFKKLKNEKGNTDLYKFLYFRVFYYGNEEGKLYKIKIKEFEDIENEIEYTSIDEYNGAVELTPEIFNRLKNNISKLLYPEIDIVDVMRKQIKDCFFENRLIIQIHEPLCLAVELSNKNLESFCNEKINILEKFNEEIGNKFLLSFYSQQYHGKNGRYDPVSVGDNNLYFQNIFSSDLKNVLGLYEIITKSSFKKCVYDRLKENFSYLNQKNIMWCLKAKEKENNEIYILFDVVDFYKKNIVNCTIKIKEILNELDKDRPTKNRSIDKKKYYQPFMALSRSNNMYDNVDVIFSSIQYRDRIIHPRFREKVKNYVDNDCERWNRWTNIDKKYIIDEPQKSSDLLNDEIQKKYLKDLIDEISICLDSYSKNEVISHLNIYIFSPEMKTSNEMTRIFEILKK